MGLNADLPTRSQLITGGEKVYVEGPYKDVDGLQRVNVYRKQIEDLFALLNIKEERLVVELVCDGANWHAGEPQIENCDDLIKEGLAIANRIYEPPIRMINVERDGAQTIQVSDKGGNPVGTLGLYDSGWIIITQTAHPAADEILYRALTIANKNITFDTAMYEQRRRSRIVFRFKWPWNRNG